MGVVYDAEDLKLNRRVALKSLPPELASDPAALERFQREARAASSLNHPNICTIYAIEHAQTDEGPRHFLAMERLEGQSLDQLIGDRVLPVDVALDLGIQVADALDAAHTRGIIHRDIKPANIFVQARHRAKVLDFGLAKVAAARVGMTETIAADRVDLLTSPGTTLGIFRLGDGTLERMLDFPLPIQQIGATTFRWAPDGRSSTCRRQRP